MRVLDRLERLSPLAPLHQPNNLAPIKALFDAAAAAARRSPASTPPSIAAIPRSPTATRFPSSSIAEGVRRYGFHGLVLRIHRRAAPPRSRRKLPSGRVVVAHLGSGASMCALVAGKSVESTMGFTALDGLPMGTRPGQLDPGVVLYLMSEKGMSAKDIGACSTTNAG